MGTLAASAAGAAPFQPPFAVAISDSPSMGDPYLIEFNVTVASGAPTAYDWQFGDGQFSNGTGPGYALPAHRYAGPGNYTASVAVFEGSLVSGQSLPLTIQPSTLRVGIRATASPGSLTETFTASVVGGSGSYPSVLWTFGDGGTGSGVLIRYTYQHEGAYVATVNVTDSSGGHVESNATVNAVGTSPGSPADSTATVPWVAALVVVGAAGLAGSLYLVRWATRRSIARESIEEPSSPTLAVPQAAVTAVGGAGSLPRPDRSAEVARLPGPPLPPEPVGQAPGPEPPVPEPPSRHEIRKEALRTSQRIVLHLWSLGALPTDEVAPLGFTQRGIATALGVSQNALTNVLRRLVAGGVLVEDVRHVRGQPRRLKVYRLTPRGEALARDLRRPSEDASARIADGSIRERIPSGHRRGRARLEGQRRRYGPALFHVTLKLVPSGVSALVAAFVAVPALLTIAIETAVAKAPMFPLVPETVVASVPTTEVASNPNWTVPKFARGRMPEDEEGASANPLRARACGRDLPGLRERVAGRHVGEVQGKLSAGILYLGRDDVAGLHRERGNQERGVRIELVPSVVGRGTALAIRIGPRLLDAVRAVPVDADPERGILTRRRAASLDRGYDPRALDVRYRSPGSGDGPSGPVRALSGGVRGAAQHDRPVIRCGWNGGRRCGRKTDRGDQDRHGQRRSPWQPRSGPFDVHEATGNSRRLSNVPWANVTA